MGRTAGKEVSCHSIRRHSPGWHRSGILIVAILCTACTVLFASEALAQCSARDVLRNHLKLKQTPSADGPQIPDQIRRRCSGVEDDHGRDVCKFFALSNALDAAGCGIGNSAGEILARPTFTLSATKTSVELFAVSAAELGFRTDTALLADIYARAQTAGLRPCGSGGRTTTEASIFRPADRRISHHRNGANQDLEGRAHHLECSQWRSGTDPHRPGWQRRCRNTRGIPFSIRADQPNRSCRGA